MPPQKAKSGLMAKYGAKLDKAVQSHATDETDYGFVRLPGGITNGIAKLVKAGFDVYKSGTYKGEYYFRAAGVVVEPESVMTKSGEMKVKGLQTSIMEAVCDTKNSKGEVTSQEEHISNILNEMRKLGAATEGASGGELEALAVALEAAGPYFRFSTSEGQVTAEYPTPRIWENWNGNKGVKDYQPDPAAASAGVQDNTAASGAKPPSKPEAPPSALEPGPEDLDGLVEMAGGDGEGAEAAQNRLRAIATERGVPEKEQDDAADWNALKALIEGGVSSNGDTGGEWVPKITDIYLFKPVDPKTKKPFIDPKTKKPRKGIEVEVKAVDAKGKKVTVESIDDKKSYKDVPWGALETA